MSAGQLLDTLIIEIKADLQDFTQGLQDAARQVEEFARDVRGELDIDHVLAGIDAGDALNAALTAPLIAASVQAARTGEVVRSQMRGIANEARRAGLGRSGALLIEGEASPVRPRRDSDDLLDAARGDARANTFDDTGDDHGRRTERNLRRGALGAASDLAAQLGNLARDLGRAAARALRPALGLVGDIGFALLGVTGSLGLLQGLFLAVGQGVSAAGAAIAAFVGGPVGLLVLAIGGLVALFAAANWDRFQEFFAWLGERVEQVLGARFTQVVQAAQRAWSEFVGIFAALWERVAPVFREHGEEVFTVLRALSEVVLGVLDGVGAAFEAFFGVVEHVFGAIGAAIRGDWSAMWAHLGGVVASVWNGVLDVVGSVLAGIVRAVDQFFPGFEQGWRDFWGRVGDVCRQIFGGVVDWLGEKTRQVGDFFAELYDRVVGHSYIPDLVDGIAEHVARLQGEMVDPIAEACGEAAGAFEELEARAGEALGTLQDHVSSAIEDLIRGRGFSLKDFVRDVVGSLGDAAVARSMEGVNGVLGGIFGRVRGDLGLPAGAPADWSGAPLPQGARGPAIINFNFPPGTDVSGFQQSQGQISALLARTLANGRRYG